MTQKTGRFNAVACAMDENDSPIPFNNGETWTLPGDYMIGEARSRGDVVVYAGSHPRRAEISTVVIEARREHMRVAGTPSYGGWTSIVVQAHSDQWLNLVVYDARDLISVLQEADGNRRPIHGAPIVEPNEDVETGQDTPIVQLEPTTSLGAATRTTGKAKDTPQRRLGAGEPPFESAVGRMEVRIPDEPETVIGLDELVHAILIPNFDSDADWTYWRRLVDLTCVVFGLEGRTEWLRRAIGEIPSAVLPMHDYLEVPKEIGAGWWGIADVSQRINSIQGQMIELQREFFRGVLLAIDPTIEHRTTTVGRLRELGLGKRTYRDWDNF